MNKRKASIDINVKQKTPSKRPSVNSINTRTNTMQQRIRPEKSPSTHILPHAEQKELPNNAAEPYIPKTRFNSQDRCKDFAASSPRLKYFPAEKIKKLENPTPDPIGAIIVQQNPHQTGTFYVPGSNDQNKGQGDATGSVQSTAQSALQHRNHQNMHTMSQQQVCQQPMHQISQINPQSECTLYQQVPINQTHRPCVPYGQRELSPQKVPETLYGSPENTATSQMQHAMQRSPSVPGSAMNQEKSKAENAGIDGATYERQPIGGRNATLYRQTAISNQQPRAQSQMSMMPNLSSSKHQHPAQNHYPPHAQVPNYPNPQNPQQAYQQLQQTVAQQQQMQQRAMAYQMQMMSTNRQMQGNQGNLYRHADLQFEVQSPGQGMSSPQETMLKQNQSPQTYAVHQKHYTMNPHNATHLKPFAMNMINPQLQFVPSNPQQQPTPQYQQQPVQLYRHPNHQLYRNPAENVNQQMAIQQPDCNHPTNTSHQVGQAYPEPPVHDQRSNQQKKTKLSFTPSMVRDQEKMLSTMKQQGVPMEIIKRQFEVLLCEQRRQLEYIEELRRQGDSQEIERPAPLPRRRKQIDEKPEWMIHLTPSRLSYIELEKLHEDRREKKRLARQMEDARLMQNEMSNQVPTNQQYQYYQPNWQHLNGHPQFQPNLRNNNFSTAKSTPNVPIMNHQQYHYQQSFPRHQQVQHPYQQQHSLQNQQQNSHFHQHQQVYQDDLQQHQNQVYRNESRSYEADKPTAEPSSLLKLRVYKERIRPQGRNNGLQDPEIVRKYLEQANESTNTQRGLEYLSSLASNNSRFKLNGMQDPSEIENELKQRLIIPSCQSTTKRISANGLENTRNLDNPQPQRLTNLNKMQQEFRREYPRQKQCNPRNCYSVQAERENGTVANNDRVFYAQQQGLGYVPSTPLIPYNENNAGNARCNLLPFRFDGNYPQHYQQMQQYYQNVKNLGRNNGEGDMGSSEKRTDVSNNAGFDRAGGDAAGNVHGQTADHKTPPVYRTNYSQPDLHEARTIGGVRYLARKQDYMPNTQLVSPETLIAGRHLQPPVIY